MRTQPTEEVLGAIVTGLNVSQPLDPSYLLQLKQALWDHRILIFHQQSLSDHQLLAFSTYFGSPFIPPADQPVLGYSPGEQAPLVVSIAYTGNGKPSPGYLGHRELLPHSDHQWIPYPSSSSMLYALEVPQEGGDTHWIDLIKAYAELDSDTKTKISTLQLITYNPFLADPGSVKATYHQNPASSASLHAHPLVRTHPENGQKILYLNDAYKVELVGMDPVDGAKLIEQLRHHLRQPQFRYIHHWSVGDIVFWDNQCTLHYRPPFNPTARRIMKRVSLSGSRPF